MSIALTIVIVVLSLLAIWVVIRQLRVFGRSIRRGRGLPYEPIPDPNPPQAVARTRGVVTLSGAALLWAGAHLVSALAWAATGLLVDRTFQSAMVAVYLCSAAFVTAIGAVMLLRCERYGRRAVAMGQFLFAMAAFMGIAVALLLPQRQDIPSHWYRVAAYMAAFMGLHLLIDTLLGAAAQHVGRQAGQNGAGTGGG